MILLIFQDINKTKHIEVSIVIITIFLFFILFYFLTKWISLPFIL